jgi:HSP20 family protein
MADSETKDAQRQTNEQKIAQQQSGNIQTTGGSGQGRAVTRRGSYSPSLLLINPRDLLSATPFELMRRFSEEMDRVFEGFGFSTSQASRGRGGASQMEMWAPPIEVFERGDNLVIRAELPGVNNEDVKVRVTDDGLVIEGERKEEREEERGGFYRSELSYGRFYRLIPLPEDIDTGQVRAEFNNGVLEVNVPVPQRRQRQREIPVGTAGGQSQAASAKQTRSS